MKSLPFLILLVALLLVAYLVIGQLSKPTTASAPLGKDSALVQELPGLVREKMQATTQELEAQQKAAEKALAP